MREAIGSRLGAAMSQTCGLVLSNHLPSIKEPDCKSYPQVICAVFCRMLNPGAIAMRQRVDEGARPVALHTFLPAFSGRWSDGADVAGGPLFRVAAKRALTRRLVAAAGNRRYPVTGINESGLPKRRPDALHLIFA